MRSLQVVYSLALPVGLLIDRLAFEPGADCAPADNRLDGAESLGHPEPLTEEGDEPAWS